MSIEALSSSCKSRKTKSKLRPENASYQEWKANHTSCQANHEGNSGSMETVGLYRIFERSQAQRGLKYLQHYGDGDSKSYAAVKDMYGKDSAQKLECTGHVQKRVGCHLRKLRTTVHGLGGKGKLTDGLIDCL